MSFISTWFWYILLSDLSLLSETTIHLLKLFCAVSICVSKRCAWFYLDLAQWLKLFIPETKWWLGSFSSEESLCRWMTSIVLKPLHSRSDLGATVMRKQHLAEVFYLKECAKNNCFSLYISHSVLFFFKMRILLTVNLCNNTWSQLSTKIIY